MTYRTKRHNSVFDNIEKYASGSRKTAEAFAARPEADLFIVEMFASGRSVVARNIEQLQDRLDLDIQVIGVGVKDPNEYPGEFVEVPRAELVDVSSTVWRMAPDEPDLLTVQIPKSHPMAVELFESSTTGHPQYIVPHPRRLDPWIKLFLVDTDEGDAKSEWNKNQHSLVQYTAENSSVVEANNIGSSSTIGGGQTTLKEF
ncbi:hypothetical protein ACFQJ5_14785 [Halomicroarcula sp. GCM10025324]|uniref:hypothetical protein n=1 Tax=Haloarcula TaxID=2237 RepID=UPI0023E7F482|nr:hypothetical protein [Halomicroarcula sp. ZS-22-S1]